MNSPSPGIGEPFSQLGIDEPALFGRVVVAGKGTQAGRQCNLAFSVDLYDGNHGVILEDQKSDFPTSVMNIPDVEIRLSAGRQ